MWHRYGTKTWENDPNINDPFSDSCVGLCEPFRWWWFPSKAGLKVVFPHLANAAMNDMKKIRLINGDRTAKTEWWRSQPSRNWKFHCLLRVAVDRRCAQVHRIAWSIDILDYTRLESCFPVDDTGRSSMAVSAKKQLELKWLFKAFYLLKQEHALPQRNCLMSVQRMEIHKRPNLTMKLESSCQHSKGQWGHSFPRIQSKIKH